jgi:hypothetical protein
MQIRTRVDEDGTAVVDVIDASDGAVTHSNVVSAGEQLVVTATSAHSPADIEVGEVESVPADAPAEEAPAPEGEGSADGEQPEADPAADPAPGDSDGDEATGGDEDPAAA